MRAVANDVALRTRARTWFRPLRAKSILGPAIGPRDLSLIAAASRRVLAVTGSAQARNVTREKQERGDRGGRLLFSGTLVSAACYEPAAVRRRGGAARATHSKLEPRARGLQTGRPA